MNKQKDNVIPFKPRKKKVVFTIIFILVFFLLFILFTGFHIEKIEVTGNKHYSKDEIIRIVKKEGYINNSILFILKNKIKPIQEIPFIVKIDLEYESSHKVKITVYEKAISGCIEYMNEYIYFDQDGYVLEISSDKLEDIPCIKGMSFASMELEQKLPIKDKKKFKLILNLTQLINKYKLKIDAIRFDANNEIILEYKKIKVELGDRDSLEEQLIDLNKMLKALEGEEGVLDMKEFDANSGKASFKKKSMENENDTKKEKKKSDKDKENKEKI